MSGSRLSGKVALITGGAQGIGEAHARIFSAEGAKVAICDIKEVEGRALADDINAGGGDAIFVPLDVSKSAMWVAAIKTVTDHFGDLTTLINNAGIYRVVGLEAETEEGWATMIGVNQTGCFLGMKHAMPALKASGNGAIVNISSILGLIGSYTCTGYHASKAAVRVMSKATAIEYAAQNVRINTIFPGNILTPILADETPEQTEITNRSIPMRRSGQPHEIAYASLFLCSDEASYITGAELSVDGGLYPG